MRPAHLLFPLAATVVVAGCAGGGATGRVASPAARQTASRNTAASTPAPTTNPTQPPTLATSTPSTPGAGTSSAPVIGVKAPATTVSASATAVSPPPQDTAWSRPDASLKAAPVAVTGKVAKKQQVRIVRLAEVRGHPVISVTTAVGPQAAAAAVTAAQQAPGSVAVNVDHRVTASDAPLSNDPYRGNQWALTRLSAENTWVHSTGAGITVAVVDTGVSAEPDLAGQLLPGYDFVTDTAGGNADGEGHGTHVAGIIAAVAGNGIGVAGIAPGVKILPVRVLGDDGSGSTADVAAGVMYAADHGAKVINLSLGGPDDDPTLDRAVAYAQAEDVVVVAAAGNGKLVGNATSYPAALPNVMAVGATDRNDAIANFSNTGSYLKVAAPGVDIESTYPGGYAYMDGTSMATPYAAGVVALTRAAAPTRSGVDIADAVYSTATDLGVPGLDDTFGYGLVNPLAAVCSVSDCTLSTPTPVVRTATSLDLTRPVASLKSGASTVLSARLRATASGVGLSSRRVMFCSRTGSAAPACVAVATDRNGLAQVRYVAKFTSTIYATFGGDTFDLPAASASSSVAGTAVISLRVGHQTLAVKVVPGGRQRFQVQRWTGRAWVKVYLGVTNAAGSSTVTRLATGAIVRIVVAGSSGYLSAATTGVRIG